MTQIRGKNAFVTGAASGIGLALARMLAGAGANVMLADIEADALVAARDAIDVDDVEAWASTIVDLLGRPEQRAEMAAAGAVRAERWAAPIAAATLVEAWRDAAR